MKHPLVGRIYRDNDPRHNGREVVVCEADDRFIWAEPILGGRRTRINRSRIDTTRRNGYSYVGREEAKP